MLVLFSLGAFFSFSSACPLVHLSTCPMSCVLCSVFCVPCPFSLVCCLLFVVTRLSSFFFLFFSFLSLHFACPLLSQPQFTLSFTLLIHVPFTSLSTNTHTHTHTHHSLSLPLSPSLPLSLSTLHFFPILFRPSPSLSSHFLSFLVLSSLLCNPSPLHPHPTSHTLPLRSQKKVERKTRRHKVDSQLATKN
ncbi:MAG: hypothetical protein JOS17DRAFT_329985 [Linnemannia elongata]|nr:MAG: hypothetical protein JOS17DRAFT_329985 [Linnemannia elongata]